MRVDRLYIILVPAVSLALGACQPQPSDHPDADAGPDSSTERENTTGVCSDGVDNDSDDLIDCDDPDCREYGHCPEPPDGGSDADTEECLTASLSAETTSAPVDVIWVIDSSGSMRDEAERVQDNMNAFAEDVSDSGVDYRVVVLSDPAYVDVPPPLGDDTSRYLFVSRPVRSDELLGELIEQQPRYRSFLRSGAVTHFVAVTDDDSAMEAEAFRTQMTEGLGREFVFHAIASEDAYHDCDPSGMYCDPGCTGPFGAAVNIGWSYYELASMTGGETFSICTADWSGLFETLREIVVVSASIPCAYEIPDPPTGLTFDPTLVNVVYTDDDGEEHTFARAMHPDRCEDNLAWYYDSNETPTRIELCEAACQAVSAAVTGTLDIALGCTTDEIIY